MDVFLELFYNTIVQHLRPGAWLIKYTFSKNAFLPILPPQVKEAFFFKKYFLFPFIS